MNRNSSKDKRKRTAYKGILPAIIALLILILVILLIAPCIFTKLYSDADIRFSDGRFGFWGNLLGGSIGGIAALIAVFFTIQFYNKKDEQQRNIALYNKQVSKIDKVIDIIINRNVISLDFTYAIGFSKKLLQDIVFYNELVCYLKGYFTEYGIRVLNAFQQEYTALSDEKQGTKEGPYNRKISVMEFLNLPPELRQCAERIGHLALYENARELIHSDPTLSYILEIEGGGSAGLWAALIHDKQGAFSGDTDRFEKWKQFDSLVQKLLIKLDDFKSEEYERIILKGDTSVTPRYCIKRSGSFMHEEITVDVFKSSTESSSEQNYNL